MTLKEYNSLKPKEPIKITKYFDKDRITRVYLKTTSGNYKGFMVGCTFYRYQDCKIVK